MCTRSKIVPVGCLWLQRSKRSTWTNRIGPDMAEVVQLDLANVLPSFPINVNLEKNNETGCWEVEIRNFIGEKLVRRVVLRPGVDVEASKNVKDQLELSGNVRSPCPSSDPVC